MTGLRRPMPHDVAPSNSCVFPGNFEILMGMQPCKDKFHLQLEEDSLVVLIMIQKCRCSSLAMKND